MPHWGPWSVTLESFLVTRIMELVVHSDDLAVSVGVDTPEFPRPVIETVVDVLSRLALNRHSAMDVVRAFVARNVHRRTSPRSSAGRPSAVRPCSAA